MDNKIRVYVFYSTHIEGRFCAKYQYRFLVLASRNTNFEASLRKQPKDSDGHFQTSNLE